MEELLRNKMLKRNYYALFLAVTKGISAKEALIKMGVIPESTNTEVDAYA